MQTHYKLVPDQDWSGFGGYAVSDAR